ncbi:hypothetical protein Tco_1264183 [Tanacetum coccineum]
MPIDQCYVLLDISSHNSPSVDEGEKLDSIKGSNKTVESPSDVLGKRKRTDEGDGAAASKIIPWELHLMIQEALKLRELVKLNKINREVKKVVKGKKYTQLTKDLEYKNDSESELVSEDKIDSESESDNDHEFELEQCEDSVRFFVKSFKKLKQLPHDWEYDPATASTFVAAKADKSALPKMPPPKEKRLGCCSTLIDPNQKFPKTRNVPLNEEEKKIWMDFKEFDKDKPGLDIVSFKTIYQHKRPLRGDNPIVSLTGCHCLQRGH